jgi:hypothetical protein
MKIMSNDITLCAGGTCPIKNFCHRCTSEVYGRQDFFSSMPFDVLAKKCSFFLKNEAYFEHIRLMAYEIWQKSENSFESPDYYWRLAEEEFLLN